MQPAVPLKEAQPPAIPTIECQICLCPALIINCLTLSCDHRFCKDCLLQDWINNIQHGYVAPTTLKCPTDKCNTPITVFELRFNLPESVFTQYLKKTTENFQTDPSSQEVLIKCPNKQCRTPYFIFRGASYFTCSICSIKYCADCFGDWDNHKGISCEEFKEKNQSPEEYELKKAMENSGAMQCPHCKNYGIKPDGCNFIYCTSSKCQKRFMFCYLCGDPLTEKDHFTHFKNQPYGNDCLNLQERLEKGNVKSLNCKMVKIKKDNEHACPGCGTKNPDECELIENFEKKICLCRSNKCGNEGKFYCLRKCKKELKEEEVFDHFEKREDF